MTCDANCARSSRQHTPDRRVILVISDRSLPRLRIGERFRAWATLPGAFVKEVEAWSIGIVDDGFTANVNVFTDTDGHRRGEIEFTGIVPMSGVDRPLHFLTYFDFKDGQAVVVTLSTSEAAFEQAREQAEPYLRTLRET